MSPYSFGDQLHEVISGADGVLRFPWTVHEGQHSAIPTKEEHGRPTSALRLCLQKRTLSAKSQEHLAGIKKNREEKRERYLFSTEFRCVREVLREMKGGRPGTTLGDRHGDPADHNPLSSALTNNVLILLSLSRSAASSFMILIPGVFNHSNGKYNNNN